MSSLAANIAKMSDAELIDAVENPGDYEPDAFELVRQELARRKIPFDQQQILRDETAAEKSKDQDRRLIANVKLAMWFVGLGLVFLTMLVKVLRSYR